MTLVEVVLAAVLAHGNVAARDSLPANPINDAKSVISFLNTGHADSLQRRMTTEAQQHRTAAQQGPDGGRTVVMELEFSAQPVQASVVYDASGQISSVVFQAP